MSSLAQRRNKSELLVGQVTVFDEGGGVLVDPHGDQRVGVAEPLGDGWDGHVLGEEPDGMSMAQITDAQAAVIPRERRAGRRSPRRR
jgi:hypothetical protein